MYRFFAVCIVLAAASVATVVFGANYFFPDIGDPAPQKAPPGGEANVKPVRRDNPAPESRTSQEEKLVEVVMVQPREQGTRTLILADGRVMPGDKADVAGDRDGPLLFLATPVKPGEFVAPEKVLFRSMTLLAVNVRVGENVRPEEKIIDPATPLTQYRHPRATDTFEPGTTSIITVPMRFRKLSEDDEVEEGQILGMIRPDLAIDDLKTKEEKVRGAKGEYTAAVETSGEMNRQLRVATGLKKGGAAALDDYYKAVISVARYKAEEVSKEAGVKVSQRELSGSWTTLKLHVIRAPIAGTIRTIYKQPGEAIKNLESVLLIQSSRRLRVETQIEVQDAFPLRERLDKARAYRKEANRLTSEVGGPKAEADAKAYRASASALVAVEIEASQPQPPVAVLRGHAQDVTCVAVSRGANPRIVSGSVDGFVRVWERVPGEENWEERYKINHHAPIRALACTVGNAKRNLVMTATATGRVRILDLDNLKAGAKLMPEQHKGPVNAIAFDAEGTRAATGGEDRSIMLWNVDDESRLLRQGGAHQAAITSLAFTPKGQLVSAGRDKGLFVWNVEGGSEKVLKKVGDIPGRSGDVTHLGLDPKGEYTLVDEGRELRVVELSNQRIDASLSNSSASGSFSTLALFSPDSKSILTNGAAAGRLQLWRAPSSKIRAAELRQFLWSYPITCGAFDPTGNYAVTGTSDSKVLVWKMPTTAEASRLLKGELTYVESFLDTSNKRVTVRATLDNPNGQVIPGVAASIIIPPIK